MKKDSSELLPIQEIRVGNKVIGPSAPPFIIAEMSGNHNQSIDRAFELVDAAAAAGADALKLQTYTPDTITLNIREGDFFISDKNSPWYGRSLYELYGEAYTPWEWHEPIFNRCRQHGMLYLSTPFDFTAVDFLEKLDVPFYKIASFENIDLPLIKKAASTGKPIIISTGMASLEEMGEMVAAAKSAGAKDIVLLKCTSAYPARHCDMNLKTIPALRERFSVQVGLSDHTLGIGVPVASVALGATVIEKHFTLRRADGGVDSAFSLEPNELAALVEETKHAWESLGAVHFGLTEKEIGSRVFRRSLYISKDIKKGERFTAENIRSVRPGFGLPPKEIENILGKTATQNLKAGTPMKWDYIR